VEDYNSLQGFLQHRSEADREIGGGGFQHGLHAWKEAKQVGHRVVGAGLAKLLHTRFQGNLPRLDLGGRVRGWLLQKLMCFPLIYSSLCGLHGTSALICMGWKLRNSMSWHVCVAFRSTGLCSS